MIKKMENSNNSNKGLLNKAFNEVELDRSISKIIVLAIIQTSFAFFFGFFLRLFIVETQFNFLLFSFLAALGFLAFFLLTVFFVKGFWIVNLITFLNVLAFSAPFINYFSKIVGAGILVSFLMLVFGSYSGRQELNNMLKIKFWRISKKSLPKAIAAVAVFVGVIYAAFVSPEEKGFFISQGAFEKIISPIVSMGLVQNFIPGLTPSSPIDELIRSLASRQIEENSQFKILPQAVKNKLINESVEEMKEKISDLVGTPLESEETVSDVFYEIIVEKLGTLSANAKSILPMAAAGLIFLTIIGLSFPIRIITTILAFVLFEICLAFGFCAKMAEGRSREIIVLKQ